MRKTFLCWLFMAAFVAIALSAACGGDDDDDNDDAADETDDDSAPGDDAADDDTGDEDDAPAGPFWDPSWRVPAGALDPIRGLSIKRGIIHAHSIYSHDACDGEPDGNVECLMELRDALCTTHQDYLMLTDHDDTYAENEYPDVLLHLPEEGDELFVDENEQSFANRVFCGDGTYSTIFAGTENTVMPLHMHGHAADTVPERFAIYGGRDPAHAEAMRAAGGFVVINHTEEWSIDELLAYAPDGVEVFNLHAAIAPNLRPNLGVSGWLFFVDLAAFLLDPAKPEPNLAMLTFWPETTAWTDRWDALLAVQRTLGILATDVHRNALPFNLWDGERMDGYPRMMGFFSNHILVENDDPATIEAAVDRGRLYGAFEYLGMPQGFDFRMTDGKADYEMGDEVTRAGGLTARVTLPQAFHLDPNGMQPEVSAKLIRIAPNGGSSVVAESAGDIEFAVTEPGAYRVEVRIVPWHLIPFLGSAPGKYMRPYPWIYANPIYVK